MSTAAELESKQICVSQTWYKVIIVCLTFPDVFKFFDTL